MDDRLGRFLRSKLRSAGEQFETARSTYEQARRTAAHDLPLDDDGRARLVCRRHAERRAVELDAAGRPDCFDPDHPDCRGCVEDVRDGTVETW
jgi:hypothetical protein